MANRTEEYIALQDNCMGVLLTKGKMAIIDASDFHLIQSHKWQAKDCAKSTTYYAHRKVNGKFSVMHRIIMNLTTKDKIHVDHINGNGLDNRRSNLRLCTESLNHANMGKCRAGTSSKYKGVHLRHKKWSARIQRNKKIMCLGEFHAEEDAALAYNFAALELFGDFARFNTFIPKLPLTDNHSEAI